MALHAHTHLLCASAVNSLSMTCLAEVEVVPYTKHTAMLAGGIDGEQRSQGVTIPFDDLLIGATALEHGYSVATVNIRHFRLIPGLTVIQL